MAYKNKHIINHITGQEILFLQTAKDTDGKLLEMETTYNGHSKEPPAHYHPFQNEDFTVLSGQLTVRINGELKTVTQGGTLHIPAGIVHAMWNDTDAKTIVNWKVQPAMNTENLLETATGLIMDGKTNKDGMPPILQVALMANKYSNVFRLAKPPYLIQKMLYYVLSPVSYLMGYKATYPKYLD